MRKPTAYDENRIDPDSDLEGTKPQQGGEEAMGYRRLLTADDNTFFAFHEDSF